MNWKLIPKFRKRQTGTSYELLQAVIKAIKEEPRRIDMGDWLSTFDKEDLEHDPTLPSCGTQGCIAGWLHILTAPSADALEPRNAEGYGFSLLPPSVRNEAQALFHGTWLRDQFNEPVREGGNPDSSYVPPPYPFPTRQWANGKVNQKRYAADVIVNLKKFMKTNRKALKAHRINAKAVYAS